MIFFSDPMFFWNVWVVFVRLGSVFFAICFYFAPVYHGIHHSLPWASSPSCTTVWEHFFGGQFFRQHQTSKSKQKVSGGEFLSKCQARTSLVSQMQRLRRKQRRRRGGNKGQQLDFETRIETTYKTWMHHYSHLTLPFFPWKCQQRIGGNKANNVPHLATVHTLDCLFFSGDLFDGVRTPWDESLSLNNTSILGEYVAFCSQTSEANPRLRASPPNPWPWGRLTSHDESLIGEIKSPKSLLKSLDSFVMGNFLHVFWTIFLVGKLKKNRNMRCRKFVVYIYIYWIEPPGHQDAGSSPPGWYETSLGSRIL